MRRVRQSILLLAGVCAVAGAACASPALASSRLVRVGAAPTLPAGSKVVGSLPGDTKIRVTVTLVSRDPAALSAYATAVSTPGSSVYHDYLTVPEFAERFGAAPARIAAVESSLRAAGLDPGAVTANGLSIRVAATAEELAKAFSTSFERVLLPGRRTAFANTSPPALAPSVAGDVQAVIGLDTLSLPQPLGLHPGARHARSSAAPHVITGGPQPCAAASSAAGSYGVYTADQLASAYKFSSLYGAGDLGAGQTVALFELEPNLTSDISAYQSCYGTSASVSYVAVDGGSGTGAGEGEAALDIEDVIGLAPLANIIVYQAPNSLSGLIDNYTKIITQDTAQVVSTSWGQCEPLTSFANASSENTLFQEAATQGQSVFAASGDTGSAGCYRANSSTALAAGDPSAQPYVTGVGGTSLTGLGPPPTESVWNDGSGAGGGGISSFWAMPSYQSGAPASLNVVNANSSKTTCTAHAPAGSYCREDPDVSADAAPNGGYLMYFSGSWFPVGGTSAAAPLWAAFTALGNASSACAGSAIGFANPALYRIAGSSAYASAFNDVTSGNDDLFGNHGGLYPAGAGYDMASGLGTPIGSTLAGYLCDRVTVGNPGTQTSYTGTPVSVAVTGTSTGGATLQYAATGLPAGLSINSATGAVSGVPSTAGSSSATVSVTSADGLSGSTAFTWNVVATAATVAGAGNQTGVVGVPVALQIHASDNNAGSLSFSAAGLPAGLSIAASSGLITGSPTTARSSTVTVTATDAAGPSATTTFTWAIAAAAKLSHKSLAGLRNGKPKLSFEVSAARGATPIKTIVIRLPKGLSFSRKAKHLSEGVKVTHGSRRAKFTAKVSHGELTIKLKTPKSSVKVTISHSELSESKSLKKKIVHKHVKSLQVHVKATNSGHTTTQLVAKLRE